MVAKLVEDVAVTKDNLFMKNSVNKVVIPAVFVLLYVSSSFAQTSPTEGYQMKPNTEEIEANFLSSYYNQDGNNAAVTGGEGTEQLTDLSNVLIVNIPLDSINSIGLYGGADFYSSASTDNIDTYMSSASRSDVRAFATVSYNRKNLKTRETYGIKAGFSAEYDYTSTSLGLSYTKEWNEGNSEININGQAFFDQWALIYPYELRGKVSLPSNQRRSYNAQLNFSQVINRKLQMSISTEAIKMTGLLSTPFHRVYFSDAVSTPDIERLPDNRLKIPIGFRLNYYAMDNVIVRSYYRYYWDNFGIKANTLELEIPIKIASSWILGPFYRFHTQNAANYFAPIRTHLSTEEYYTSDFDLSAFQSHKYGLNLRYSPLFGLLRSKPILTTEKILLLKYLETRFGFYERTTGLKAKFISLNLGFSIK
jgi:hypothetical protein